MLGGLVRYIFGPTREEGAPREREPAGMPRVRRAFSEHQIRLKAIDPEEDEAQCPNCGSSRLEPYSFDPDAQTKNQLEREDDA